MSHRRAAPSPPRAPTPVDQAGLEAAVQLFCSRFVVPAKQRQLGQRLATAAHRVETLTALPRWLAGLATPLAGADQGPAGIEARFGDMPGVVVDVDGACRVGIGGAVVRLRGQAAIFVSDAGRVALVARIGEPPLLALRM